jgi:dihydroflavonol-4-reductase
VTVFVTGSTGHIGANLVRALLAEGRQVRALIHNRREALEGLDIERVTGSTTDFEGVKKAMAGCDTVYHLAAIISISGRDEPVLTEVNIKGTGNVARAALENGVKRMVHFSSTHALSEFPDDAPIDENRPLAEGTDFLPYDRSKGGGEREIAKVVAQGLDAVTVNPCGVLGPFDFEPSRMGRVLLDLHNKRLPALIDGGYTWVDARDVVAGAMAAEAKGRSGERYILCNRWASVKEIGELAERATGVKSPRMQTPMWLAKCAAPFSQGWARITGTEAKFTLASLHALGSNPAISNQKAKDELGFSPRPLEETIAESYAWFKESGRIPKA